MDKYQTRQSGARNLDIGLSGAGPSGALQGPRKGVGATEAAINRGQPRTCLRALCFNHFRIGHGIWVIFVLVMGYWSFFVIDFGHLWPELWSDGRFKGLKRRSWPESPCFLRARTGLVHGPYTARTRPIGKNHTARIL